MAPGEWGRMRRCATTIANRTGLGPQSFEQWLDYAIRLDREARAHDTVAVASIIFADMDHALRMARQIEQAGLRVLELNIGTPYAREAKKGTVTTELDPVRVEEIVATVRKAVSIPIWVKTTGQSERVPELAERGVSRRRGLGDHGGAAARPDPRRRDLQADARHGARHRRLLEPAAHLLLARGVARAARADKPLIGINGAQSGLDVARMMLAGASAVEIASAVMLRGYGVLSDALAEFERYLARQERHRRRPDRPRRRQPQVLRRHAAAAGQLEKLRSGRFLKAVRRDDRPLALECGDLVVVESVFGQYRAGVFAVKRRAVALTLPGVPENFTGSPMVRTGPSVE